MVFSSTCGMRVVCLALALQVSVATQFLANGKRPKHGIEMPVSMEKVERGDVVVTQDPYYVKLLTKTHSFPPGAGCKDKPKELDALSGNSSSKLQDFNVGSWSGYCELNATTCPDARINQDYMLFAQVLHEKDPQMLTDKRKDRYYQYCKVNGFLAKEYTAAITSGEDSFNNLQRMGADYCKKPAMQALLPRMTLAKSKDSNEDSIWNLGEKIAILKGIQMLSPTPGLVAAFEEAAFIDQFATSPAKELNDWTHNNEQAYMAAAWSCAAGDVSCDIAYCQWTYVDMMAVQKFYSLASPYPESFEKDPKA